MDKEIKDKWLAALKSGKYEQGQGRLRSSADKYCCFGVLCDILGKEWEMIPGMAVPERWKCEGHAGWPPDSVVDGTKIGQSYAQILIELNDGGSSFSEIADFIKGRL